VEALARSARTRRRSRRRWRRRGWPTRTRPEAGGCSAAANMRVRVAQKTSASSLRCLES
jgi:hypothetical protein